MSDRLLLFSGGMDSYIAWHYLDKPDCLYVDLGHRYNDAEKRTIKIFDSIHQDMNLKIEDRLYLGDKEEDDAHIPNRNAFLALIASFYSSEIYLIVQKGETKVKDRSMSFFYRMRKLMSFLKREKVNFSPVFDDKTKVEIVAWYLEQGLPTKRLLHCTSCYYGVNCGSCSACFREWVAHSLNGFERDYIANPWSKIRAKEYYNKAKEGYYGDKRGEEIIEALERRGY